MSLYKSKFEKVMDEFRLWQNKPEANDDAQNNETEDSSEDDVLASSSFNDAMQKLSNAGTPSVVTPSGDGGVSAAAGGTDNAGHGILRGSKHEAAIISFTPNGPMNQSHILKHDITLHGPHGSGGIGNSDSGKTEHAAHNKDIHHTAEQIQAKATEGSPTQSAGGTVVYNNVIKSGSLHNVGTGHTAAGQSHTGSFFNPGGSGGGWSVSRGR